MRGKHAAAAGAAGIEFGDLWLDRWNAGLELAAGRRWAAARRHLRAARAGRDLASLAQAIGVSLGPSAYAWMRALSNRRAKAPAWLSGHAIGDTVPAP